MTHFFLYPDPKFTLDALRECSEIILQFNESNMPGSQASPQFKDVGKGCLGISLGRIPHAGFASRNQPAPIAHCPGRINLPPGANLHASALELLGAMDAEKN